VLQRLGDGGQRRARLLPLARVCGAVAVPVRVAVRVAIVVALLVLDLPAQALQVEVAQGIRAQAAALEGPVGDDVGVLLQLVRDLAEDIVLEAVRVQALEQQKRLESGVRRDASIHPPVPGGGRRLW